MTQRRIRQLSTSGAFASGIRFWNPGRTSSAAFLVVLAGLAGFATNAGAATSILTPEAKRDLRLQPGVVYIEVRYSFSVGDLKFDNCGASGTGFLYRPDGYLITNGHVVQLANAKDNRAQAALLRDIGSCLVRKVDGVPITEAQKKAVLEKILETMRENPAAFHKPDPDITVKLDNGVTYKGEIKAYSDPVDEGGKDVAIIKIDGKNLPTVPLGNSDEVSVGDEMVVIGYPGAANAAGGRDLLVPTVTHGKVSAVNKTDYKGTPVLQSDVAITHGNSGGPAFDQNGRVVGIATFGSDQAAGFNFFVPLNTALEFVRQAGAPPQSGLFDDLWSRALDAYSSQRWSRAHELMGGVLEVLPGQPDARSLQEKAAINRDQQSSYARGVESIQEAPTPMLIGGGLILVALAGGLGIIFLKPSSSAGVQKHGAPAGTPPPLARTAVADPAPKATVAEAPPKPTVLQTQSLGALHIVSGPLKGKQYPIPQNGLRIGRDPQACAIVLPNENVGREHAWVMPVENGRDIAVIDRGSANGTYLNSTETERIRKVVMKNGDRIFICRENTTEIMFSRS